MKFIASLFLIFMLGVTTYMTVAFWVDPSYRAQMGNAVVPCGIVIHCFLVGTLLTLYLQITHKPRTRFCAQ